jgi:hypothetical protein
MAPHRSLVAPWFQILSIWEEFNSALPEVKLASLAIADVWISLEYTLCALNSPIFRSIRSRRTLCGRGILSPS